MTERYNENKVLSFVSRVRDVILPAFDKGNKDYLIGLFEAMYDELPMPKPKMTK